jgi:hypothetical protein
MILANLPASEARQPSARERITGPQNLSFRNTNKMYSSTSDAEECKCLEANYLTFAYSVSFFNV